MSSIVGHALAGISITSAVGDHTAEERKRKLFTFAALLAIVPDLDVPAYIIFGSRGISPHRGITHTVLFAILFSILISLLGPRHLELSLRKTFIISFCILLSHLALDYFMGCGLALTLFWPISNEAYLFPYKVTPMALYGLSGGSLMAILFHPLTLIRMLFEVTIFLPLVLLPNRRPDFLPGWVLLSILMLALIVYIIFYNHVIP